MNGKFGRFLAAQGLGLWLRGPTALADVFGSGENSFSIDFVPVGKLGALKLSVVLLAVWNCMALIAMALPAFQPGVRIVALSEQHAPGADAGVLFRNFELPMINNLGQTAFAAGASASAGPHFDHYGVWFEDSNNLKLAEVAPGNGSEQAGISSYAFSDQNTVVVGRSDEIRLASASSTVTLAKVGDPLPGEPDHTFLELGRPTINKSGAVAFEAADQRPPYPFNPNCCSETGVWTAQQGSLISAARNGQPVPNSPGEFFRDPMANAQISADGKLTFYDGTIYYDAVVRTNVRGFYEKVVTQQTPAPGLPGLMFNSPFNVVINGNQDVVFEDDLKDAAYHFSDSLWLFREGTQRLIERQGDPAPGAGAGVTFSTLGGTYWKAATGGSGDVAFFSYLQGPGVDITSDSSVWRYRNDALQLVAKSGTAAPGFPDGSQFSSVSPPVMNNLGQIAFQGVVQGSANSTDAGTHVGIWAEDAAGVLRLVIRDGDTIDVDPGPGVDLRTVAATELAINDIGYLHAEARGSSDQAFALNDVGQLAFKLTFTDSSQAIIVSNLLAVPEPSGVAFLLVGIAGTIAPRKRTRCARC